MINILVWPGDVFEQVLSAPPRVANWLAPTLLVCGTGLFLFWLTPAAQTLGESKALTDATPLAASQAMEFSARVQMLNVLAIWVATGLGLVWSALVLWLTGRWFLKARFPFGQALGVVGLSSTIVALGTFITALLVQATGNPAARPSLSLLLPALPLESHLRSALDALNVFHLWATAVLAIGLSKLGRVPFQEAAFWVFGYWILLRLGLILLS